MRSTPALAFGISGDGEDVRIVQAVRKLRGLEFIVRFKPGRTRPDELRALHAEIENLQTRGRALLAAALPASATGVFALSASLASPGKARKVWPSLLDL
ncbi:MAG: hypothetical protein U1E27_12185, partial [Kiritimatiellia bacterium]|nr:hypothetical protein [Kiritimatiellia bacterium]